MGVLTSGNLNLTANSTFRIEISDDDRIGLGCTLKLWDITVIADFLVVNAIDDQGTSRQLWNGSPSGLQPGIVDSNYPIKFLEFSCTSGTLPTNNGATCSFALVSK